MTSEQHTQPQSSYREGKHRLRSIRWMLFFVVATQTVVTVAANLIASFFTAPPPVYLQVLVIELLAYLLPLALYARENRLLTARDARERFGLKQFSPWLLPLVLLAGFGCQFIMIVLDLPVSLLLGVSDGYIPQNPWELAAAMLVIAIIPAVFEEFLLRGIVYGVMADFNTRAALIFTAVMFALMHGSAAGFFGYLFLGVMLVLVLRRTGSLYACMAFHLANNVTALLLSYFSGGLLQTPTATIWLFVIGALAFALACLGFGVFTRRPKPARVMNTSDFLGQSFINLPVLLCIASVIALLFLQTP